MNFKKVIGLVTALVMLVSLCQFSFAAESSSTQILIGDNRYLDLGADLNGVVGVSSKDNNPVPSNAKYTNGFYVQGAQVRTTSDETDSGELGLRFIIVNNTDMTAKMVAEGIDAENIAYGALVQLDKGILLNFNNAVKVPANHIFKTSSALGTDYQKYTACVTEIPVKNMRQSIAVRPYIKYTDLSNVERVLYGEQYSCDAYSIAFDAYNGDEKATTKEELRSNILSKFADANGNFPYKNEFGISEDDAYIQKWRDKTDSKITKIRYTGNMTIPSGSTVYYVSNSGNNNNDGKTPQTAWATLTQVNGATLKSGDYVLFERGGTWRGQLQAKAGVTYSAYGEGAKPIICGSTENGADSNKWKDMGNNIWRYENAFDKDVGSMVFRDKNGNESYATKWAVLRNSDGNYEEYKTKTPCGNYNSYINMYNYSYQYLTGDLNFLHSNVYSGNNKIYLYSEENPGTRFESIEFLRKEHGITIGGDNITIDNLCIKYVGAHGISAGIIGIRKNLTVTNCEFNWIGGSAQAYNTTSYPHSITRYGNAIEIYGGCDRFTVSNCYFYQIYDAAVTHQFGITSLDDIIDTGHYNVTIKDNVMEYCAYSIESWWRVSINGASVDKPEENQSHMDNVLYENNLMWYAGQGLGSQRPDETQPAHIKGFRNKNYVGDNFVIRNNFMAYSTSMLVDTNFNENVKTWTYDGVYLENNIFVGNYGQDFGMIGYYTALAGNASYVYGMEVKDEKDGKKTFVDYIKKSNVTGNKYYFIVE